VRAAATEGTPELVRDHRDDPSPALTGATMAAVVVIWGLGPPVTKLISAPPLVAVSVRFWASLPIVWAAVYATGRRMSLRLLRSTALAGVLFVANLACLFTALHHASVAVVSVVAALQPGIVLLVAGRWLGERPTRWHVVWTLIGIGGVAVVILGGEREVRGDGLGFLLSFVAMLCFTGYYLINRRARSTTHIDPIQWIAGVTTFATVAITPLALATSTPDDYRELAGMDWVYLGFVAFVIGIVGHTLMSWVHKFTPASRSSLYLLGSNVVAIGVAWPMHHEPITLLQAGGGVIVLGAVGAVVTRPTVHVAQPSLPLIDDFVDGPPLPA
jgi:drug/metabolite transporter (DMT)-like permease